MRRLFTTTLILLLAMNAKSQLFLLNYFTGASTFGSLGVTVTAAGSTSSSGASPCLGLPTDVYWVGPGGVGSYTYVLSRPIYRIGVHAWGVNGGPLGTGEYMAMAVNGSPYPLTPVDVVSYTECMPGGGPMYLSTGFLMGPLSTSGDYNGGDIIIQVCTGINSFTVSTNGTLSGVAYTVYVDTVRPPSCVKAINNSPCIGDSLKLNMVGDSLGATYLWTGPGGFTSTLQNPFIYPSTFPDSGLYTVIRFLGVVNDTDSTRVVIHPKPIVSASSNSPLCAGLPGTLNLYVNLDSAGEQFLWSGPLGFTSTMQNAIRSPFVSLDSGMYYVYATTIHGCKDTGQTRVAVITRPRAPVVTNMDYCQGNTFIPYTVSGIDLGDTVLWYYNAVGGFGGTVPIAVNTLIPGVYNVWVSQKLGACESLRGTNTLRVTTTPPAPLVTGIMQYCQYIGTVSPLTVTTTTSGVARWYTSATGTSYTLTQPFVNINAAGTTNWWVSQIDSTCESPRTPVAIIVHPKPAPPVVTPTPLCQFRTPIPLSATPSTSGDFLLWYGPGVTVGSTVPPVPPSTIAPDTTIYYVTETSIYGCVSDSAIDANVIKVKPPLPLTSTIAYCQHGSAHKLNAEVDSIGDSHLNWYYNTTSLNPTPTPFTDTVPGTYTWYVSQTVPNSAIGCEGDSAAVSVTIIYKPVFDIKVSSPSVCQYDSIHLAYHGLGQSLFAPGYMWILPAGAMAVGGTTIYDSLIVVRFDTANQNNFVHLVVSNDSGFCTSDTTIHIKVIKQPEMGGFTQPDVCLGDTVMLGLSSITNDPRSFSWYIDNIAMKSSPAIKLISLSSNSGGPFSISWLDTGMHRIMVTSTTIEGCKSNKGYDSVNVRPLPDASFMVKAVDSGAQFCLEDSVLFAANSNNIRNLYQWSPTHEFSNLNKSEIYGRMELGHNVVTLKVTDPYGCVATTSQSIDPGKGRDGGTCCTVLMPNAFTPNGEWNRTYSPVYEGFHRFHIFRIVNRWGTTMFEGGNTNVSWDGTFNGVPQDMGVYFYYLKYDCGGITREVRGDVTLIR
jgi:gliding motility-associated-like protein